MSWKTDRDRVFSCAKRVVVKVGSAVLTNSDGLDDAVMENIVRQLVRLHARGMSVVLVSSGAVAAGRAALRAHMEHEGRCISGIPGKQAAAAVGQSRLMHRYDEAFARHGVVSAQMLLTRDDLRSRQRFLNVRNTFAGLLQWRAIPIVNENETVAVQELKFGDNDTLASLLLNAVEADLFINLTSSRGVYSANPDRVPDAEIMECVEDVHGLDLEALCGGKTLVGSGGMYSKLSAARRAAQLGVPTLILPGREPDIIERAMGGERIGTWVSADARGVSRRKFWMAYNAEASGTVIVDQGAVTALREKGKSLLPAGIVSVDGNFGVGALVRIVSEKGETIGVGLSNYAAAELRRVMGRKLAELEAEDADHHHYAEAIHRDNLMLGAVV